MSEPSRQALADAHDILKGTPLIDGHNDWPHLLRAYYGNHLTSRLDPQKSLAGHVDFERLARGKSGGVFWSAFMPCATDPDHDLVDEQPTDIVRDTLQQIDTTYRTVEAYHQSWEMVHRTSDIMRIFKSGKLACLIGVEGLHQIGHSASVLRMYHRLGVRYVTLAHSKSNRYADSATAAAPVHGGLSSDGRKMIDEMNRIGMLVDLSHTSNDTALDVLKMSRAPVAFTHSSAAGLVPSPRNTSDEALDLLKKNNGIIMISLIPSLTHSNSELADAGNVVDHVLYVAERIGFDHVGIGSDFDGMYRAVSGVEDVSKFPELVATMLERGITREHVEKIVGLNIIRVLQDVEDFASRSHDVPVLEDHVKPMWDKSMMDLVRREYPDAEV